MGKKKAVLVGNFSFESQKLYEHHCRTILDTKPWGKPLVGEQREFALAVLLHRRPEVKPEEIAYITVDDDGWKSRCFYVAYTDDRERHHFTYKLEPASPLKSAMRSAVKPQIRQTGAVRGHDVHHEDKRFEEIVSEWVGLMKGLGFADIALTEGGGNEYGRYMACPFQKQAWVNYHKTHANLVVLPKEEHKLRHGASLSGDGGKTKLS